MDQKSKKQKTTQNYNYNAPLDQPLPPLLDRLSALPEDIIVDILSVLPTRTVISTSVLSHRWHFLWTQATSIRLNCREFSIQTDVFYAVVENLLARLTSPFIRTFSIRVPSPRQQHFEPWLRQLHALKARTIKISVDDPDDDAISSSPFLMPYCIFQTQSLVRLILRSRGLYYTLPHDIDFNIELPQLKILDLKLCASHCGFITKLVRSCPLLRGLYLSATKYWGSEVQNHDSIINISGGQLKILYLYLFPADGNVKVVIDAPSKLERFYLGSHRFISCSFVKKPITLHKAEIITSNQSLVESLLPVILKARVLDIRAAAFSMFESFKDDQSNALIYRKLTNLTLRFISRLVDNRNTLDNFPFELTSPSLLRHVKRISVECFHVRNRMDLMKLGEYLLTNAPALEILDFVISDPYCRGQSEEIEKYKLEEMLFCIDLYSCSKKSSQCAIEFRGQLAKLPNDVEELQEMENQVKILEYRLSELPSLEHTD